ncbi:TPA: hypothetical protein ACGO0Y_000119, partial [Streptococcus suis]
MLQEIAPLAKYGRLFLFLRSFSLKISKHKPIEATVYDTSHIRFISKLQILISKTQPKKPKKIKTGQQKKNLKSGS